MKDSLSSFRSYIPIFFQLSNFSLNRSPSMQNCSLKHSKNLPLAIQFYFHFFIVPINLMMHFVLNSANLTISSSYIFIAVTLVLNLSMDLITKSLIALNLSPIEISRSNITILFKLFIYSINSRLIYENGTGRYSKLDAI